MPCPFQVGDLVVYAPSQRTIGATANFTERLIPDRIYRITEIKDGRYVLVEGYMHSSGGLYYSEFRLAQVTESPTEYAFYESERGEEKVILRKASKKGERKGEGKGARTPNSTR